MKKWALFSFCLSSMLFMGINQNLFAVNRNGALIITPMIGRYNYASKRHLENQTFGSLSLGYGLTDQISAELFMGNLTTNRKTDDEGVSGGVYNLNAVYHFLPAFKFQPYVLGGVGVVHLHPSARGDADVQTSINAGVGIAYYFNDQIGLRADARDLYVMAGGKNDLMFNFGVSFLFFGKPPMEAGKTTVLTKSGPMLINKHHK